MFKDIADSFIELCYIADKRNSICKERTSLRNKLYRFSKAEVQLDKFHKLERMKKDLNFLLDAARDMHRANQSLLKVCDYSSKQIQEANHMVACYRENIVLHIQTLSQNIAKFGEVKVPKSIIGMTKTDIKIELTRLRRDKLDVELRKYEFTKETRKRINKLSKELNVKISRDGYYNRINYIETANGERIYATEIAEIVKKDKIDREARRILLGDES